MAPQDDQHFEVERGFPLQFGIIPASVARDARIGHVAFRLWVVLATYADRGGSGARPSTASLVAAVGASRETVKRARRELRDRGLLDYEAGTGRRATRYVLRAPREGSLVTPPPESRGVTHDPSEGAPMTPDQTKDQITTTPPVVPPSRSRGTVNRKPVTAAEEELGQAILAYLTEKFSPRSPFRWEIHRTRIVGRIRMFPTMTLDDHRAAIDAQVAHDPWWERTGGNPDPRVIYGRDDLLEAAVGLVGKARTVNGSREITGSTMRQVARRLEEAEERGIDLSFDDAVNQILDGRPLEEDGPPVIDGTAYLRAGDEG